VDLSPGNRSAKPGHSLAGAGGVYKSTDGGVSWIPSNNGLYAAASALVVDPQNSATLYAGTPSGVFKSTNGGAYWTLSNSGLTNTNIRALAIDPQNPAILFAGTGGGVFKSTDHGTSWSASTNGVTGTLDTYALTIHPQNTSILYAGFWNRIFKSSDGGASWNLACTVTDSNYIYSLAIDPQNPIVHAGIASGGVITREQAYEAKSDILWRNSLTGQTTVWFMDGTYTGSFDFVYPTISNPAWKIAGQGDFNADGRTDILWRNTSNGQTLVWFMNGVDYTGFLAVTPTIADTNWDIAGVHDFNGDGKPDLLWRNSAAGLASVWLMNGTTMFSYHVLSPSIPDLTWKMPGVGDFDNDAQMDILWRNSVTGQTIVWFMSGANYINYQVISPTVTEMNWIITGIGDFNADGYADIAWRNPSSSQAILWLMNGTTLGGWQYLAPAISDSNWNIVGPK
jgi:hypothetical protein